MALPRDVVVLSDDQFNKLVELLTPGYELALAYQAQMRPQPSEVPQELVDLDDGKAEAGADPDGKADASTAGEGIPGTMEPGPAGFRKSAPAPEFDDPSKQGSG